MPKVLSIVALAYALVACIPPQQQQGYGTQPNGQQQPQQQQAQSLTCMQLFSCFQGCNSDNNCIQNCLAQTDQPTQQAATAFMQCGASKCENGGSDCVAEQCSDEMAACHVNDQVAQQQPQVDQQQPAAEQMRPGQPHTTANLVPWLTGQWIGTNHQFEFYGDGRVRRSGGTAMYNDRGDYKCVSVAQEIGTVVQQGDMLIMSFAPADENHCGNKNTKDAGVTVRYRITWYQYSDGPVNLLLVDVDCPAGQAMYCNDQMVRR